MSLLFALDFQKRSAQPTSKNQPERARCCLIASREQRQPQRMVSSGGYPQALHRHRDAPMANDEHVALLKQGVAAWNAWRDKNPEIRPNLGAGDFWAANLSAANLNRANLSAADLTGAGLIAANLRGGQPSGANLNRAGLDEADLRGPTSGERTSARPTSGGRISPERTSARPTSGGRTSAGRTSARRTSPGRTSARRTSSSPPSRKPSSLALISPGATSTAYPLGV
jgi:hypothetical protein